jgi:radical SAM protein with 4Fe4S-binding SPASM domain
MNDLFLKIHEQLPVFMLDCGSDAILYTPGGALKIEGAQIQKLLQSINNPENMENSMQQAAIQTIMTLARSAVINWEIQKQRPFSPDCLTIHVGSDCNSDCTYCYSKAGGSDNKKLVGFPDSDAIDTLFKYIVGRRTKNSGQFTVVYHGSGEPTFHWQKLISAFKNISDIAKKNEVQVFNYIATNGNLNEYQVSWLVENMDLIGISCDGPPAIQKKQRSPSGTKYRSIEKVCKRIVADGGQFENRVTITPDTLPEIKNIAIYLIEKCQTKNIRIEPVFLTGEKGFKASDADDFFNRFIEARNYAEHNRVGFSYAGIRMEELHGTYCDVLRNTLRLTSDDVTRNCFCFMRDQSEYITGRYANNRSVFNLTPEINELKKMAAEIPHECMNCINVYHCSRGCPDYCIFNDKLTGNRKLDPFRCRLHQLLAVERIRNFTLNK